MTHLQYPIRPFLGDPMAEWRVEGAKGTGEFLQPQVPLVFVPWMPLVGIHSSLAAWLSHFFQSTESRKNSSGKISGKTINKSTISSISVCDFSPRVLQLQLQTPNFQIDPKKDKRDNSLAPQKIENYNPTERDELQFYLFWGLL